MPTYLAALTLLVLPGHAACGPDPPAGHPCERELLDDEEAFERNAWAAACGFVPEIAVTWAFVHDLWIAFEAPGAPVDANDPCGADWGAPVNFCPALVE